MERSDEEEEEEENKSRDLKYMKRNNEAMDGRFTRAAKS